MLNFICHARLVCWSVFSSDHSGFTFFGDFFPPSSQNTFLKAKLLWDYWAHEPFQSGWFSATMSPLQQDDKTKLMIFSNAKSRTQNQWSFFWEKVIWYSASSDCNILEHVWNALSSSSFSFIKSLISYFLTPGSLIEPEVALVRQLADCPKTYFCSKEWGAKSE